MNKRIGNFSVGTYPESPWVVLKYHCNEAVEEMITLRQATDIFDLEHVIECVKRELLDRRAPPRKPAHD